MTIDQHAQPPQPTLPRRRASSPAAGSSATGGAVPAAAPAGDRVDEGPLDEGPLEDVPVLIELPDLTWHRSPGKTRPTAARQQSHNAGIQAAVSPTAAASSATHTPSAPAAVSSAAVGSSAQAIGPETNHATTDAELASPRQLNEERKQRRDAVLAAGDRRSALRAHAITGFVVALVAVAAFWAYRQQQGNSPADGRSLAQEEFEPWDEHSPRIDFDEQPAAASTDVPPALPAPALFLKPERGVRQSDVDQKTAAAEPTPSPQTTEDAWDRGAVPASDEASRMTFGNTGAGSNSTAGLESGSRQPDSRPASYVSSRPDEYRYDRPSPNPSTAPEAYESYDSSRPQPDSYPVFTIPKRESGLEPAAGTADRQSTLPDTPPSTSRSGAWSYERAGEFGGAGNSYPTTDSPRESWSNGQPAAPPTGTYPSTSDPNPPRYPRTNW
ncbi:MAG: hypothetical protein J5I93_08450 [Pirellulaceae bacterium]|nr:hypothetical protein [Pirellulaceae bacterium]